MFFGVVRLDGNVSEAERIFTSLDKTYKNAFDGLEIKQLCHESVSIGYVTGNNFWWHREETEIALEYVFGRVLPEDTTVTPSPAKLPGILSQLPSSRGDFCGFRYDKVSGNVSIFSDKFGIRPIYYINDNGHFCFSVNFKSLSKAVFNDNPPINNIGMLEEIACGVSLSNRTVVNGINRIGAAEIISGSVTDKCASSNYWHWSANNSSSDSYETSVENAFTAFQEAVAIRKTDAEQKPLAFLSGGLDSRVIGSMLKKLYHNITTLNFGVEQSQDTAFAEQFSKAIGSEHLQQKMSKFRFPNFSVLASTFLKQQGLYDGKKPNAIWSGDGGSVGAGFVYLNEKIVESYSKSNDIKGAITELISVNNWKIPENYFNGEHLSRQVFNNIQQEINQYEDDKEGWCFYRFLLLNDQQRHMDKHFETWSEHHLELHLPFFDAKFLHSISFIPFANGLGHKFYMDWVAHFPDYTLSTPWQTYPGHIECPIRPKGNLSYQWSKDQSREKNISWAFVKLGFRLLLSNSEITKVINVRRVFAASILHWLKIRNATFVYRLMTRLCDRFPD